MDLSLSLSRFCSSFSQVKVGQVRTKKGVFRYMFRSRWMGSLGISLVFVVLVGRAKRGVFLATYMFPNGWMNLFGRTGQKGSFRYVSLYVHR